MQLYILVLSHFCVAISVLREPYLRAVFARRGGTKPPRARKSRRRTRLGGEEARAQDPCSKADGLRAWALGRRGDAVGEAGCGMTRAGRVRKPTRGEASPTSEPFSPEGRKENGEGRDGSARTRPPVLRNGRTGAEAYEGRGEPYFRAVFARREKRKRRRAGRLRKDPSTRATEREDGRGSLRGARRALLPSRFRPKGEKKTAKGARLDRQR